MNADGSRPAADLGQLPERLHARRDERRPDHLRPLGVRRPPGHPDPEPVDDQPRRHRCCKGFFGNRVLDPATFIEPQPIPGSDAVLCTLTGHNGSCRGAIGLIDPSHGDNAQDGDPQPDAGGAAARRRASARNGPQRAVPDAVSGGRRATSWSRTTARSCCATTTAASRRRCWRRDGLGFYNPRPVRPRAAAAGPPSAAAGRGRQAGRGRPSYLQDVYNGLAPHVQPRRGQADRRGPGTAPRPDHQPRHPSAGVRLPAGAGLLRRHLRAQEGLGLRRRGRRRLGLLPGARPGSRSTSWRWTPKAAPCSGCAASRT